MDNLLSWSTILPRWLQTTNFTVASGYIAVMARLNFSEAPTRLNSSACRVSVKLGDLLSHDHKMVRVCLPRGLDLVPLEPHTTKP
ncbi:unnamed protein product [Nippostrongylus brasiliensis]|uniref:Secreted protein n=1 Tax=Nippostrongylus brasiliensis TaxID=27835 RepID=A0A0N4XUL2_NIPBR|nr:unnamed protein product [Nippostrongylus brasiliensis]